MPFTIIIIIVSSSGGGGGGSVSGGGGGGSGSGGGGGGGIDCHLTIFFVFLTLRIILLNTPRPIPHFIISPYIINYLTDQAIP